MPIKDKFGVKLKFPNRSCKECDNYPCLDITNLRSDFAKYGCTEWAHSSCKTDN